jgi:hypothetical protein
MRINGEVLIFCYATVVRIRVRSPMFRYATLMRIKEVSLFHFATAMRITQLKNQPPAARR